MSSGYSRNFKTSNRNPAGFTIPTSNKNQLGNFVFRMTVRTPGTAVRIDNPPVVTVVRLDTSSLCATLPDIANSYSQLI